MRPHFTVIYPEGPPNFSRIACKVANIFSALVLVRKESKEKARRDFLVNIPSTDQVQRFAHGELGCGVLHYILDDPLLPFVWEPNLSEGILLSSNLIIHAAKRENQCTKDSSPIFTCGTMNYQRLGGLIGQMKKYFSVGRWSSGIQNVNISSSETLCCKRTQPLAIITDPVLSFFLTSVPSAQ